MTTDSRAAQQCSKVAACCPVYIWAIEGPFDTTNDVGQAL